MSRKAPWIQAKVVVRKSQTTITLPSEAESEIPTQTPTASSTKGGALQGTVTVETKFGELEVVTLKIPLINVGVKVKVSVDPKISWKAGEEGVKMRAVRMTVEVSAGPAAVIVGSELTPEELLQPVHREPLPLPGRRW